MKYESLKQMLVDEIGRLNGSDFHWVCVLIMKFKLGHSIRSVGVNNENKPIGHIVDALKDGGAVVGEFGTDQDYFKPPFTKVYNDLEHVDNTCDSAKEVYLFSSRPCPPSKNDDLNKIVDAQKDKYVVYWYDCSSVAEEIIEIIEKNDSAVDYLANYLTAIIPLKIFFSAKNYFKPPSGTYIERGNEDQLLKSDKNTIVVSGVSGMGKTEYVAYSADLVKDDFDWCIWIKESALSATLDLENFPIGKLGHNTNIYELIREAKVLLVLDGFDKSPDLIKDVSKVFSGADSKLIVTSQLEILNEHIHSIKILGVSQEVFYRILNYSVENDCPAEIGECLFTKCSGSPLVARVFNDYIRNNDIDWNSLENIEESLKHIEGPESQKLLSYILRHQKSVIGDELEVLKWLNTTIIESSLLRSLISDLGVINLVRRSFLKADISGAYHLHDLIKAAIDKEVEVDNSEKHKERFLSFFMNSYDKERSFNLAFVMHKNKAKEMFYENSVHGLACYLYLLTLDNDHYIDSEFRECENVINMDNVTNVSEDKYCLMSFIELREVIYRYYRYSLNCTKENYEKTLRETIESFNLIEAELETEMKASLLHHRGKAKKIINDIDGAKNDFQKAISIKADSLESKLQLFKIFHNENNAKDKTELIIDILEQAHVDSESVSLTLLLAAFQQLRNYEFNPCRKELFDKYKYLFKDAILNLNFGSSNLALEALAGVGFDIGKDDLEFILDIMKFFNFPTCGARNNRVLINAGLFYRNLYLLTDEDHYLDLAINYFDNVKLNDVNNDFLINHIGDAYNFKGDYSKAIEILSLAKNEGPFVKLALARSYNGIGKYPEAHAYISEGIDSLEDFHKEKHLEKFTSLKEEIESNMS